MLKIFYCPSLKDSLKFLLILQILLKCVTGEEEYVFKTSFYETQLDHFSFTNDITFPLKYLYNDTYWLKNNQNNNNGSSKHGPIFLYTGNEGDIELFAQNTGFMWEIAPQFNALLLFVEHRYYGASLPFGNESFSHPSKSGYLSSEQALADFASFITWFKTEHNLVGANDVPVIAFGGSYGGMLTAWVRMKYPHVIAGGIAASAPVLQFTGITSCNVFGQIVTQDFEEESSSCAEIIRKSWSILNEFGSSKVGRAWLNNNWKLCNPIVNSTGIDQLKSWLVDIYGNLAMVNYPYPSSFLATLPGYPIRAFCSKLNDPNLSDKLLLKSLYKGLGVYFNGTGQVECLDINVEAKPSLGIKGWDYQACTEMIMPMCYDGINDFFEPVPWNLTDYLKGCENTWGVKGRPYMAQLMYGGKNLEDASNIVFSNGLLDPWSGGGILQNQSSSLISIIIPEGAHHLDLRSSNPLDPTSVLEARKLEKYYIQKWIDEYHQNKANVTNKA